MRPEGLRDDRAKAGSTLRGVSFVVGVSGDLGRLRLDRYEHRDQENAENDHERKTNVDVMIRIDQRIEHLKSDEPQDDADTFFHVREELLHALEQEVERTQAEHGEDVRSVDDQWIA